MTITRHEPTLEPRDSADGGRQTRSWPTPIDSSAAGWFVPGRLDLSSPLDAPGRIHPAWPASELDIIDDEGHGGASMTDAHMAVLADI